MAAALASDRGAEAAQPVNDISSLAALYVFVDISLQLFQQHCRVGLELLPELYLEYRADAIFDSNGASNNYTGLARVFPPILINKGSHLACTLGVHREEFNPIGRLNELLLFKIEDSADDLFSQLPEVVTRYADARPLFDRAPPSFP